MALRRQRRLRRSRPSRTDTRNLAPEPELAADVWPKQMIHPGFPNGGATGMLVKDYRGKNAEQEIWKFDAALVSTINDTLKQAAIEEGNGPRHVYDL